MDVLSILRPAGYAAAAVALAYFVLSMGRRIRAERQGRQELPPSPPLSATEADKHCRGIMERDRQAAIAHRLTVIGLLAGIAGHLFSPLRQVPGIGAVAAVLGGIGLLGGALALITGSLMSLIRRLLGKTARFTRSAADLIPLISQILLGASGALYFGALLSDGATLRETAGVFHDLTAGFFLVCFCSTKLYHIVGFSRLKRAGIPRLTGALPRDPGVEALRSPEPPDAARIGLSCAADLTALQRIEVDAGLSCGLCDAACPATMTGKRLSPKRLTRAQVDLVRRSGGRSAPEIPAALASDATECAQCYACETACPFSIPKVDRIVGIRRHALLEKGEATSALRQALRKVERTGNVAGMRAEDRQRLLEAAGIPLLEADGRPDYVLWLGCQAAYDPRIRTTVIALSALLRGAGRTVAAFKSESCCGDLPRRIGEESLFLDLVEANRAALELLDGVPLLTVCPHCATTLGRTYAELGVSAAVLHYTQVLEAIPAEAVAMPAASGKPRLRVAYHDSCYLSRLLGVIEEPRRFLARMRPDVEPVPLADAGMDTLCCGGGGGRGLAEEAPGDRVALRTIDELVAKKVDVLLVSCPFCRAMYSDAAAFRESGIQVMDLLEFAAAGRAVKGAAEFRLLSGK